MKRETIRNGKEKDAYAKILAVFYTIFGTEGGQIADQTDLRPLAV